MEPATIVAILAIVLIFICSGIGVIFLLGRAKDKEQKENAKFMTKSMR